MPASVTSVGRVRYVIAPRRIPTGSENSCEPSRNASHTSAAKQIALITRTASTAASPSQDTGANTRLDSGWGVGRTAPRRSAAPRGRSRGPRAAPSPRRSPRRRGRRGRARGRRGPRRRRRRHRLAAGGGRRRSATTSRRKPYLAAARKPAHGRSALRSFGGMSSRRHNLQLVAALAALLALPAAASPRRWPPTPPRTPGWAPCSPIRWRAAPGAPARPTRAGTRRRRSSSSGRSCSTAWSS